VRQCSRTGSKRLHRDREQPPAWIRRGGFLEQPIGERRACRQARPG
jgi:hypothetical protein